MDHLTGSLPRKRDYVTRSSRTSDLTKKRRVRGGHKSHVTEVLGQADQLSNENGLQLRQQNIQLEEKLAAIKILDNQILDLLETEQDSDHEIDESSKFCERIYTTLLQIDDKLKQLDITASGGGNGNSAQPFQGGAGAYTKLPKLQLRKFYGKAHEWTEFWDSFKASVDANQGLSPVLTLEYLKIQCKGAAYQAIAGLELSDSNYEVAIDILKDRFGQRQIILNSHIDALMKINALYKIADVSEVRRFYDTV